MIIALGEYRMDYQKYTNLEAYLFNEVGPAFRDKGVFRPVDLYLLLIWKSNRSKNKTKRRLAKIGGGFENAVSKLSNEVFSAKTPKERLGILMKNWGLRLPTATAILSVMYPKEFTVYDRRVCSQLGAYNGLQNLSWQISVLVSRGQ